jgi:ribonuclease Z
MSKFIVLGSAQAIPDEEHDNTHFALVYDQRVVLIDTGNNPIVRLKQAGLDILWLSDLILTHFHPDHVAGVPMLLLGSWLLGRKQPLNIYGYPFTIDRVQKMMDLFDWSDWPGFYTVNFHIIPEEEQASVLVDDQVAITASPVHHMLPNMGLRVNWLRSGQSIAISGDTEPCAEVIRLGTGTKILFHEASGAGFGHSSAAQAGEIAHQAQADQLVLIHYDTANEDLQLFVNEARATFGGPVSLAFDLMEFSFSD